MDLGQEHLSAAAGMGKARPIYFGEQETCALIKSFAPQIILYRPVADSLRLHNFAMTAIEQGLDKGAKLAIWLMDDWPARLEEKHPGEFRRLDRDLRSLLAQANVNFAISRGMANVFGKRYGVHFKVAHNAVAPEEWPKTTREKKRNIVIRYAGSLAPDMSRESVNNVARAVSSLAKRGVPVRFEGRTQKHWMYEYGAELNTMKAVSFKRSNLDASAYRRWLCGADILLIAYNFDKATRTYLNYSFANKIPETMAAGTAILAYGPETLETIAYLRNSGAAMMVMQENETVLKNAILSLVYNNSKRMSLGETARTHAFRFFDARDSKAQFKQALTSDIVSHDTQPKAASSSICLVAAPPLSIYRRVAAAIHENAPVVFKVLSAFAKILRLVYARARASPSNEK